MSQVYAGQPVHATEQNVKEKKNQKEKRKPLGVITGPTSGPVRVF